jgi:hypothetical protein
MTTIEQLKTLVRGASRHEKNNGSGGTIFLVHETGDDGFCEIKHVDDNDELVYECKIRICNETFRDLPMVELADEDGSVFFAAAQDVLARLMRG